MADIHNDDKKHDQTNWKLKFQELLGVCQEEIKKTTSIGIKMLNATTSNSKLHETYEELGRLAKAEVEANNLNWENTRATELMNLINELETQLSQFEDEVQNIKKD